MADYFCDRCGEFLPEGSIRYTVHIQILSDFEGIILFEGEEFSGESQHIFNNAHEAGDQSQEDELFQELSFVLCGKCKSKFTRDPFNRGTGFFKSNKAVERLFH